MPMTTRGDTRIEHSRPPSTKVTRSRNIEKAREDLLKIKLELAQLALQRAEEEDSEAEYLDDKSQHPRRPEVPKPPVAASADCTGGQRDSLRPFLKELTSAIKIEQREQPNPSASKFAMTLPNFNGSHTEWLSFRAIYETFRTYYTKKYQSLPDISLFSNFLSEQAHLCSAIAPPESIASAEATTNRRVKQRTHIATDKPVDKCRVCDVENHYAPDCTKFRGVAIENKSSFSNFASSQAFLNGRVAIQKQPHLQVKAVWPRRVQSRAPSASS